MRILVIGGSGFMGSHIVDALLRNHHEVSVYDLHPEQFRRTPAGASLVIGDFGNAGALDELIATGFDVVIHSVSTTTPKTSNESPVFDVQSNVIGTLHLLDICVARKVGRLVFMSSGGTVYGDIGNLHAVDELHLPRPMCSYAVAKLTIEHYLDFYKQQRGLDYVVLRVSNPYGERQNPLLSLGALTVFLHRAIKRQAIEVWGDGSITRDFIYVGDVADAVQLAATLPISGTFNVGSGMGLSLRDILEQIRQVTGLDPEVRWLPSRPFDVPRVVLDSSKFRNATGWRSRTQLADGMRATAEWLRHADI